MDSTLYNPVSVAHPGDTITYYLETFGWSQRDLARRTGLTTKTISEICNGKAPISTTTSLAFEKVFSRPAHFWRGLQTKYDEVLARNAEENKSIAWKDWLSEFPISEMRKRGWLSDGKGDVPKDASELLRFLGVSNPSNWQAVWDASKVAYRQTRKFETSEQAISVWVRAIELEAEEIEVGEFDEKLLKNSLAELRSYTRLPIDKAFDRAQSILSKCGVAFVWMPALKKTGISGCTKWLNARQVILALSLRYKSDDQIWFTFFHELGHILLHRKSQSFILDNAERDLSDGIVDPKMQKLEEEANRFAADTLISPALFDKFISCRSFNNDSIHEFSEAIDVGPGIVVGRLQREKILERFKGNDLKQRVDWTIAD